MLREKERNFLYSTWTIVSSCSYKVIPGELRPFFFFFSAIVDTKPLLNGALPSSECARPGLHDFLKL